ncbi:hypothetical protein ABZ805_20065 [Saccharopolyspora sp. NPDC047091]|uniref:hypothetical protein n=1 Tax=Saccharopolyspora sp. NPDC047091 TaxID=3155924 RepID=UPI0033EFBEB6
MNADDVVRVRYAPGLVGETRRVVHAGVRRPDGDWGTLCAAVLRADEAELVDGLRGMPCMVCVRTTALRSAAARAELGFEAPA